MKAPVAPREVTDDEETVKKTRCRAEVERSTCIYLIEQSNAASSLP
jgi:hypothetical protein